MNEFEDRWTEMERQARIDADKDTEIDRLREELAASEAWRRDTALERDFEVGRRKEAEARLAAVIALCDEFDGTVPRAGHLLEIRDAATGDTK